MKAHHLGRGWLACVSALVAILIGSSNHLGAQPAYLVKDINQVGALPPPQYFVDVNGTLFFVADDGVKGRELWKSDGTAAGTVLVKDIRPGSGGSIGFFDPYLTNVNGMLFFTA